MSGFDQRYAEEQVRRAQHPVRRLVRHFYLENIVSDVRGPTIDFGCGAGQLLARLPPGSVGLEVNPYLVDTLARAGLNVLPYDADADGFALRMLGTGKFRSLVVSHVLEHFSDAESLIRALWASAARLGVERIVAVVPGAAGYRSDATHRTFVTLDYLKQRGLLRTAGFALVRASYFPVNIAWIGEFFAYHELKCVYDREA